jgi:hypothetical protein
MLGDDYRDLIGWREAADDVDRVGPIMAGIAHYTYPIPRDASVNESLDKDISVFPMIYEFPANANREIDSVSIRYFLCVAFRVTSAVGVSGHAERAAFNCIRIDASFPIHRNGKGFAKGSQSRFRFWFRIK